MRGDSLQLWPFAGRFRGVCRCRERPAGVSPSSNVRTPLRAGSPVSPSSEPPCPGSHPASRFHPGRGPCADARRGRLAMSKEMVISANRHETRVALLEDDQLVEVHFQRAHEYSLAGSIHKGRVTRVLPGMQSAFVDLGLERDTFLYVSDFLEEHEDIDRITGEERPSRGDRERGDRGERDRGRDRRPQRQQPALAVVAAPEAAEEPGPKPATAMTEAPPAAAGG